MRLIFSLKIRVQTMDFGRQRGFYLMERTDLRRWAVERRVVFWSSCVLMLPGVVVVFHILLDGAKRSYNHRDCCCFELPNSLNLYFQVFLFVTSSFSVVLTEVLVSRGIVTSMRRQVLSFLFFSTTFCLSAAMVLSVWMGISLRMMTLSFSVMLISSSFTSMPNSLQIIQCMCEAALL